MSSAHLQLEHHAMNVILRLRAGWDKLIYNLISPYYGVSSLPKKWQGRIDKLDKSLSSQLNSEQMNYWTEILKNARAIAEKKGGLKDVRDLELHQIARRAKETFGDKSKAHTLSQLETFSISEHFRLQDSFLLFLGIIRSGPLSNHSPSSSL